MDRHLPLNLEEIARDTVDGSSGDAEDFVVVGMGRFVGYENQASAAIPSATGVGMATLGVPGGRVGPLGIANQVGGDADGGIIIADYGSRGVGINEGSATGGRVGDDGAGDQEEVAVFGWAGPGQLALVVRIVTLDAVGGPDAAAGDGGAAMHLHNRSLEGIGGCLAVTLKADGVGHGVVGIGGGPDGPLLGGYTVGPQVMAGIAINAVGLVVWGTQIIPPGRPCSTGHDTEKKTNQYP